MAAQSGIHPFVAGLSDADKVAFVLAYPFAQADQSFVFANGRAWPLQDFDVYDWPGARVMGAQGPQDLRDVLEPFQLNDLTVERFAVLAVGSNASPEQLARKFADSRDVIPTVRARLVDHSVVFAGHIAGYGSIPATLHHTPGAVVQLWVNFLTAQQLEKMDATETLGKHYAFAGLKGIDLTLENDTRLFNAAAYIAIQGVIAGPLATSSAYAEGEVTGGDGALALRAITHERTALARASQADVMEHVRARIAPDLTFEEFVLSQVRDRQVRLRREAELQVMTVPTRLASPG